MGEIKMEVSDKREEFFNRRERRKQRKKEGYLQVRDEEIPIEVLERIREEREKNGGIENNLPRIEYIKDLPGKGEGFPIRSPQGMIFCPKKQSYLGLMRCGEYQEGGCKCEVMATKQELELLNLSMQWRDRENIFKKGELDEE